MLAALGDRMRDYAKQAKAALSAYLERGKDALNLLRAERYDETLEILKRRTAAFHNFRVADVLLREQGVFPVALENELRLMWKQIENVDKELKVKLVDASEEFRKELSSLIHSKQKIGRYHSGYIEKVNFELGV